MNNIIDLSAKRNEREQPDAEFVRSDEFGRPLYTFGVEYRMDDRTYSFHLIAYDWEDAERRVAAIREDGKVFGQIMTAVPG
jgi:hypothetical protein